jgi:DNA-binding NarL/FixJ family response regulator
LTASRPPGQIAARDDLAGVHVMILTTFDLDEYVFEAIRADTAGFLVKDTSAAELRRAVRVVAGGDALMSPGLRRRLISEFAPRTRAVRPVAGIDQLTQREREVVALRSRTTDSPMANCLIRCTNWPVIASSLVRRHPT